MKKLFLLLFVFFIFKANEVNAQEYKNWKSSEIKEFYIKESKKPGNRPSDFVPAKIKPGVYTVKVAQVINDYYSIEGTKYYLRFKWLFSSGFIGIFGVEGVLEVGSSASQSVLYIKPK